MSSLSLRQSSLLNRKNPGIMRAVLGWIEMRRTRIALSRLDARLLEDIGLTHDTAQAEARRWTHVS